MNEAISPEYENAAQTAMQDRAKGSVENECNRLDRNLTSYESLLDKLNARLDPALRANVPRKECEEKKVRDGNACTLANCLDGLNDRLDAHNESLNAIIDRIDL